MEFNFSPFEEDIVIIGKKSSGKSFRAKKILSKIRNLPYWVYDYSNQFSKYGTVVKTTDKLGTGQFIFQPKDKSYQTFVDFCNRVYYFVVELGNNNLTICIDEIHQYLTKQSACPELYTIVLSLRNYGVSGIYISTLPTSIPNWILANAEHIFAYKLTMRNHVDWMKDYIGDEAELLLKPDKRKRNSPYKNNPPLPEYSYIYRKQSNDEAEVVIP